MDNVLVDKAIDQIRKTPEHHRYFFEKLSSPVWIEPLLSKGFFRDAPDIEKKGEYLAFRSWPESRYLARMANLDSASVAKALLEMKDTDNPRVHEDVLDAIINLDIFHALAVIKRELKWLKEQDHFYLNIPVKLQDVILRFIRDGKTKRAIDIAGILWCLKEVPDLNPKKAKELGVTPTQHASPQYGEWEYIEGIKRLVPELIKVEPLMLLELLVHLLNTTVLVEVGQLTDFSYDYSHSWRPAIEDHEQNGNYPDARATLIEALRDTCFTIAQEGIMTVVDLITFLDGFNWPIFRRISLYLLQHFECTPQDLENRLTNNNYFFSIDMRYEYFHLLAKKFNLLSSAKQEIILGLIDEGPDVENIKQYYNERSNRQPTLEEVNLHIGSWQLDRLEAIAGFLPVEWKDKYQFLSHKYSKSEHPDFVSYHSTAWRGPTSPVTVEEISEMPVTEIVNFLTSWKPSNEWHSSTPEGIARVLEVVISKNPAKFSSDLDGFEQIIPTYARAVISGFNLAQQRGEELAWGEIVYFCDWIVSQRRDALTDISQYMLDADPDWGWSRKSVAFLIKDGLSTNSISYDLRKPIWSIIEKLSSDPEPTPEYEQRYKMGPELSINVVRGVALYSVIAYARWVCDNEKLFHEDGRKIKGFEYCAESKAVLEEHLNSTVDSCCCIRSIYGQKFVNLLEIDYEWVRDNTSKIFAIDNPKTPLYNAACQGYLNSCSPDLTMYEILKPCYESWINMLDLATEEDLSKNLSRHLIELYALGAFPLAEENNPISQFYNLSSDSINAFMISHIGRILKHEDNIRDEVIQRLKEHWEQRRTDIGSEVENHKNELTAFSWYVLSNKFPPDWVFCQLNELISRGVVIEPLFSCFEFLASVAAKHPIDTIKFLRTILNSLTNSEKMYISLENINAILLVAKEYSTETQAIAREAINRLVILGFHQYHES
ncbi:hypothetical protein [Pelosinus sp. sgz500959]|uniref:hypothetical protein n=1 Tax=Pelosinus sp. sgz500959 TaxID=3242472 RepID=UPI00366B7037